MSAQEFQAKLEAIGQLIGRLAALGFLIGYAFAHDGQAADILIPGMVILAGISQLGNAYQTKLHTQAATEQAKISAQAQQAATVAPAVTASSPIPDAHEGG